MFRWEISLGKGQLNRNREKTDFAGTHGFHPSICMAFRQHFNQARKLRFVFMIYSTFKCAEKSRNGWLTKYF